MIKGSGHFIKRLEINRKVNGKLCSSFNEVDAFLSFTDVLIKCPHGSNLWEKRFILAHSSKHSP